MSLSRDVVEQSFIHPDPAEGYFRCLRCDSIDQIALVLGEEENMLVCTACESVLVLTAMEVDADGDNPS